MNDTVLEPAGAVAVAGQCCQGNLREGHPDGFNMCVNARIEAYPPCPVHAPAGETCTCMHTPENLLGVRDLEADLTTKQLAQFIQCNILASGQTVKAEDASTNSIGGATPVTTSAPTIEAGTGGGAAAFTDFTLATSTETVSATVNAISSNTFTVTGTITAGASRAYTEVGLNVTAGAKVYLLCHDTFTALNVSNGGTLAVTYTFTFT